MSGRKLNIPFIRDAIVPALKSGTYKQAYGVLRDGNAFCCLGVMCDLSKEAVGADWDGELFLGDAQRLPPRVTEYVGLSPDGDYFLPDGTLFWGQHKTLMDLNDDRVTFPTIADRLLELCDYVEANEPAVIEVGA